MKQTVKEIARLFNRLTFPSSEQYVCAVEIVQKLHDGRWHSVDTLAKEVKMDKNVWKEVLDFLVEFHFVVLNDQKTMVKALEILRI